MNENEQKNALVSLGYAHDWDAVRIALEELRAYLEVHEPHAKASISHITETIEALPEEV